MSERSVTEDGTELQKSDHKTPLPKTPEISKKKKKSHEDLHIKRNTF